MAQIQLTSDILTAALEGLQLQRRRVDDQIAQVRTALGSSSQRGPATSASGTASKPTAKKTGRRELSAAARERIAEAQRKRWAAYRKEKQKA